MIVTQKVVQLRPNASYGSVLGKRSRMALKRYEEITNKFSVYVSIHTILVYPLIQDFKVLFYASDELGSKFISCSIRFESESIS